MSLAKNKKLEGKDNRVLNIKRISSMNPRKMYNIDIPRSTLPSPSINNYLGNTVSSHKNFLIRKKLYNSTVSFHHIKKPVLKDSNFVKGILISSDLLEKINHRFSLIRKGY